MSLVCPQTLDVLDGLHCMDPIIYIAPFQHLSEVLNHNYQGMSEGQLKSLEIGYSEWKGFTRALNSAHFIKTCMLQKLRLHLLFNIFCCWTISYNGIYLVSHFEGEYAPVFCNYDRLNAPVVSPSLLLLFAWAVLFFSAANSSQTSSMGKELLRGFMAFKC